jgi:hypothetical protein
MAITANPSHSNHTVILSGAEVSRSETPAESKDPCPLLHSVPQRGLHPFSSTLNQFSASSTPFPQPPRASAIPLTAPTPHNH